MLAILFILTAALYSSIGLGGGSTYIALLVLVGISTADIPITALTCNICVVSINLLRYRGAPFPYRTLVPLLCASVPMAYLGGQMEISPALFQLLLGTVLIISGFSIGIKRAQISFTIPMTIGHCIIIGSILGGLAGLVGIGGGIFLIPILHTYNIEPAQIARISSGFILFNSIAGIIGQFGKIDNFLFPFGLMLLVIAVLIGALLGTQLHLKRLSKTHIQRISMILIVGVGCRLLLESWNHFSAT